MAKKVELSSLGDVLEYRILRKMRATEPNDPRMRETMLRIGLLIEAHAKLNVRRWGMIDTGRLFNSIRSEYYRKGSETGVKVGSFGVPYASMNEFGGIVTDRQRRAMFASLRDRGKLKTQSVDKGVIQGSRWIKRPFLRPAVAKNRGKIVELIRELFK